MSFPDRWTCYVQEVSSFRKFTVCHMIPRRLEPELGLPSTHGSRLQPPPEGTAEARSLQRVKQTPSGRQMKHSLLNRKKLPSVR